VHVVAKQSEPVHFPLFRLLTLTAPVLMRVFNVETDVAILPSGTNFDDEGIRSCKVVVEDRLPSSQTVKSKLLFVFWIKPTMINLSDWKSNGFFSKYNTSHQWLCQKLAVLRVDSLLIVLFTSVRRTFILQDRVNILFLCD